MPTPMTHAHIPVLAPHSLEPDDRVCLLLTVTSPGWELTPKPRAHLLGHSMAEGAKAKRGRDGALAIVSYPCLDWHDLSPMGYRQSSSPTGPGLSLVTGVR